MQTYKYKKILKKSMLDFETDRSQKMISKDVSCTLIEVGMDPNAKSSQTRKKLRYGVGIPQERYGGVFYFKEHNIREYRGVYFASFFTNIPEEFARNCLLEKYLVQVKHKVPFSISGQSLSRDMYDFISSPPGKMSHSMNQIRGRLAEIISQIQLSYLPFEIQSSYPLNVFRHDESQSIQAELDFLILHPAGRHVALRKFLQRQSHLETRTH